MKDLSTDNLHFTLESTLEELIGQLLGYKKQE